MGDTIQDLRYGLRKLFSRPGFTAIIILTLALGIGANTAIFSAVRAVLLAPLPYPNPDRLAVVGTISAQTVDPRTDMQENCSYADLEDWRAHNHSFEELGAFRLSGATIVGNGNPERVPAGKVSSGFFPALGVDPLMGRWFRPGEDKPGGEHVVVLSYAFWKNRLGGAQNVLDQHLVLGGTTFHVVGVMPASFKFLMGIGNAELWEPFAEEGGNLDNRDVRIYSVIGRIKPAITLNEAQADLEQIEQNLAGQYPEADRGRRIQLADLHDFLVGGVRLALWLILGAVGFVLLIACTNVANLLLGRAAGRQKEIAVRSALGASRLRIVRQLLVENLILALAGGAAGLALESVSRGPLLRLGPSDIPRLDTVRADSTVFIFAFVVSILCGLMFGLVPAVKLSRPDLVHALKEGGRASEAHSAGRIRGLLGVLEVAFSIILLAGAGLLVRSFVGLTNVSPGFNSNDVLTLSLSLPSNRYRNSEERLNFYRDVLDKMREVPGVQSAAFGLAPPFTDTDLQTTLMVEGRPKPLPEDELKVTINAVSPAYFETLQIPIETGRSFSEFDRNGTQGAAIINREAADKYWAGENPVGQFISVGISTDKGQPERWQIVGIAGNVHETSLEVAQNPMVYLPVSQQVWGGGFILMRTASDPKLLQGAARAQVTAVDPEEPVMKIVTMDQLISGTVSHPRFYMTLVGAFAGIGLLLALIGVYGIMSYSVQDRAHEIGVRMALGGNDRQIVRMVMGRGMLIIGAGLALGLVGVMVTGRVMVSLLFGVSPADPATIVAVSGVLVLTGLVASYVPARRATRIDPLSVMRGE